MKLNPRHMQKMMKQMGMQATEMEAEEVVIKLRDRSIVISEPQVTRVNVMGQDTFQVMGKVSETASEKFTAEDLRLVRDQTGAGEQEARAALEKTGDIAAAIMKLKGKR